MPPHVSPFLGSPLGEPTAGPQGETLAAAVAEGKREPQLPNRDLPHEVAGCGTQLARLPGQRPTPHRSKRVPFRGS